eukprot:GHVO01021586.1.p1 GENE.GHVO01021586.1~~GHVO01021586.1.p1  ORF type:complete len:140 (-),score=31.88 GHVO01021586.1:183-602(-)
MYMKIWLSASLRRRFLRGCIIQLIQPPPVSYSHLLYHTATSCIIQPSAVSYSHLLYHTATYCIIQPPPVSYSHLLYHTATCCIIHTTCCIIQPPPVSYSHLLYHTATVPVGRPRRLPACEKPNKVVHSHFIIPVRDFNF